METATRQASGRGGVGPGVDDLHEVLQTVFGWEEGVN